MTDAAAPSPPSADPLDPTSTGASAAEELDSDAAPPPPLLAAPVAEPVAAPVPAPEAAAPLADPVPAPEAAALVAPLAPKEPPFRPNYVFLAVVSVVSLALDLGTKMWAKSHLEDAKSFADRHLEVIPKAVSLIFARNKGGAWGLLQDQPESIRRPFFLGISVLAILFIVSLYRRLTAQQTALKWGLPLVLGGALGNLVNRIQYNFVVDFIDVYVVSEGREHHWPTFNVADIAICIGVGLMAVDMFTSRRTPKKLAASSGTSGSIGPEVKAEALPPDEASPSAEKAREGT